MSKLLHNCNILHCIWNIKVHTHLVKAVKALILHTALATLDDSLQGQKQVLGYRFI